MLYLSKNQKEKLLEHAKREAPNEACVILAGQNHGAEKVYEMINTDNGAKTYFMDPEQQLKVMKEIRNSGVEMIGIYHSHLETEAYPSAYDVELAYYPDASYVIVSIKDGDNPSIRSFKIVEGKITEEEVVIK